MGREGKESLPPSRLLPVAWAVSRAVMPTRAWRLRTAAYRLAGVKLAKDVVVNGDVVIFGPRVSIGRNTWLGLGSCLISTSEAGIEIGSNCDVGPYLLATVGSHRIGPPDRRAGAGLSQSVHVGDGCWIGARVTILPGVRIGHGCVVAAGAVVTEDQPPNSLVAGIPARVIRDLPIAREGLAE